MFSSKRIIVLLLLFFIVSPSPLPASIPYLSIQDLKALYPKSKHLFDWQWPTIEIQNEPSLVKQCQEDFREYTNTNSSFKMKYPIATGNITLAHISQIKMEVE